jgi:hypothetical protein
VERHFIEPGKSVQNSTGSSETNALNQKWCMPLDDARQIIERVDYNLAWPHSSLGFTMSGSEHWRISFF